jgi:hypothetical protein
VRSLRCKLLKSEQNNPCAKNNKSVYLLLGGEMEKCSICLIGNISKSKVPGFQKYEITCETCGTYIATEETES